MPTKRQSEIEQRLAMLEALERQRQSEIVRRDESVRYAPAQKWNEEFQQAALRVPKPKTFPASIEDFYRLIVDARDRVDAQPRFKKFLRGLYDDGRVDSAFESYQRHGFPVVQLWDSLAVQYSRWWTKEKTAAKKRGGRARAFKAGQKIH